jgi:hypothetical protein
MWPNYTWILGTGVQHSRCPALNTSLILDRKVMSLILDRKVMSLILDRKVMSLILDRKVMRKKRRGAASSLCVPDTYPRAITAPSKERSGTVVRTDC